MKNYYQSLGLEIDASDIEIKKAYREHVKRFHPDKHNGDKFFEEKFKEIQEAYEVLSDFRLRKDYDLKLKNILYGKHASSNATNGRTEREQEEDLLRKQNEERIRWENEERIRKRNEAEIKEKEERLRKEQERIRQVFASYKLEIRPKKILNDYGGSYQYYDSPFEKEYVFKDIQTYPKSWIEESFSLFFKEKRKPDLVFSYAEDFIDGLALVYRNNKYGFINKSGSFLLPQIYEEAYHLKDGALRIKDNEGWKFYDKGIRLISTLTFEKASDFNEGLARVKYNGKFGFINLQGALMIENKFDDCSSFNKGYAAVLINNKYGLINKRGQFIIEPIYDFIPAVKTLWIIIIRKEDQLFKVDLSINKIFSLGSIQEYINQLKEGDRERKKSNRGGLTNLSKEQYDEMYKSPETPQEYIDKEEKRFIKWDINRSPFAFPFSFMSNFLNPKDEPIEKLKIRRTNQQYYS